MAALFMEYHVLFGLAFVLGGPGFVYLLLDFNSG